MSKTRRSRPLSRDERRLWAEVARSITPLPGRALPEEPAPASPPATAPAPSPPPSAPPPPVRSGPPPLAPLERREITALRRGKRGVDAAIDLHGMRQAEAHGALLAFLARAQGAGHGLVLVVTGKGGAGAADSPFGERGVLRRVVPHWLRLPDVRPLVLGFEEAAARHGGSGALYVRLRRRRGEA